MRRRYSINQRVERSREIRLWIRDIIVPTAGVGLYLYYKDPEIFNKLGKIAKIKVEKFKKKLDEKIKNN